MYKAGSEQLKFKLGPGNDWILKQFQKLAEKKVGAGKQAGRCLSSKLIGAGECIEREISH